MDDEYYTRIYAAERKSGCSAGKAAASAASAYLDGRPRGAGLTTGSRDAAFSASPFLRKLPASAWREEALALALGRLVGQGRVAVGGLLVDVATVAPAIARRAVRISGMALQQTPRHWPDVARLAASAPDEFGDFHYVLDTIKANCQRGRERVAKLREPFAAMSPLAILAYASLYAFKHVVTRTETASANEALEEEFWRAVNQVFAWKLGTTDPGNFRLTERDIGECLRAHLSPWLFPTPRDRPRTDLLAAFEELMDAENRLQDAVAAAETFCYSRSGEFVRRGDAIEFIVRDLQADADWRSVNERMSRVHEYWLMRGMLAFIESPLVTQTIGRQENHEQNTWAFIKAFGTGLRLHEVYGVGETVTTEAGAEAPLFKVLLARELTTQFGQKEFIQPFLEHLTHTGDWTVALRTLAIGGMVDGMQNRLPLTFSRREDKIRNLVDWTVDGDQPTGSRRESRAIVGFWTSDCSALARRLRQGEPGLVPELFERPYLKLGQYLFELPWISAYQNNQTAAINNLRRLGSRRAETARETGHIEKHLGTLFRKRGFRVSVNWDAGPAGEVDLVCARDGGVLVLEVKSSYMRRSVQEAWLHRTMTLRRAGEQLRRKVPAVGSDGRLVSELAQGPEPSVRAWIVDTSMEHDHERFAGFLKVSVEELIIALRDDLGVLLEAEKTFSVGRANGRDLGPERGEPPEDATLYPEGFTFASFVEVVESGSVWARPAGRDVDQRAPAIRRMCQRLAEWGRTRLPMGALRSRR